MGNSASGEEVAAEAIPEPKKGLTGLTETHPDLTPAENASLETTLRRLSPERPSSSHALDKEAFVRHLGLHSFPNFAVLLYASIESGNEVSWNQFRELFVDIIRSNNINPLKIIHSVLLSDVSLEHGMRTKSFFRLLLEFVHSDYPSSAEIAARLSEYCRDSFESPAFIQFVASHLPLASQAITTFFHSKFCPDVRCPKPFHLPSLESNSSIVSHQCELFPLSLVSASLQGRWVQLYSSDSHGFSFNRVAHHILGYHVSLQYVPE